MSDELVIRDDLKIDHEMCQNRPNAVVEYRGYEIAELIERIARETARADAAEKQAKYLDELQSRLSIDKAAECARYLKDRAELTARADAAEAEAKDLGVIVQSNVKPIMELRAEVEKLKAALNEEPALTYDDICQLSRRWHTGHMSAQTLPYEDRINSWLKYHIARLNPPAELSEL